jgi:hypothetical protein
VLDAHALAAHEQLGWFDALIVDAAPRSGCSVLFTEDPQDGRRLGELEVRSSDSAILARTATAINNAAPHASALPIDHSD